LFNLLFSIVEIRAHSFKSIDENRQKPAINYGLATSDDPEQYFSIDRFTGVIHLLRPLDFDDSALLRVHRLQGYLQPPFLSPPLRFHFPVNNGRPDGRPHNC
jgi:hypothetical protein